MSTNVSFGNLYAVNLFSTYASTVFSAGANAAVQASRFAPGPARLVAEGFATASGVTTYALSQTDVGGTAQLNAALTQISVVTPYIITTAATAAGVASFPAILLGGAVTLIATTGFTYFYEQSIDFRNAVDNFENDLSISADAFSDWVRETYENAIESAAQNLLDLDNFADFVQDLFKEQINDLLDRLDDFYDDLRDDVDDLADLIGDTLLDFSNSLELLFNNSPANDQIQQEFDFPTVSPLVLDLDHDRQIELIPLTSTSSSFFDLDADGFAEQTGWVQADDGFLAMDRNGDGIINDITELFGNAATDGFIELAELDSNDDGVINAQDAAFDDLLVWQDSDGDGFSDSAELASLASWNINSIDLNYTLLYDTNEGHRISSGSTASLSDGTTTLVQDVWFQNNQHNSFRILGDDFTYDERVFTLPQLRGFGDVAGLWVAMSENGQLLDKVSTFAQADYTAFVDQLPLDEVEDILFSWTGVDGVDPASHGPGIDARIVEALEEWVGRDYVRAQQYPDGSLGQLATDRLSELWEHLVTEVTIKLLVQIPTLIQAQAMQDAIALLEETPNVDALNDNAIEALLAPVFEQASADYAQHPLSGYAALSYDYVSDRVTGDLGAFVASFVAEEPNGSAAQHAYWHDKLSVLTDVVRLMQLPDEELQAAFEGTYFGDRFAQLLPQLAAPESEIGTVGDDNFIARERESTFFYGGAGDDRYFNESAQQATILIGRNDGHDHFGTYSNARVVFTDNIAFADISITRDDPAGGIRLELPEGGSLQLDLFSLYDNRIEFVFADQTLTMQELEDAWLVTAGTGGDDTIFGFYRDFEVDTGGGDDVLLGTYEGQDTLIGGGGNDTIKGDPGHDRLIGGTGHDSIEGGAGNDFIRGGSGHDTLWGDNPWTGFYAGNGADTLWGGAGRDVINGGAGQDILRGGGGRDRLIGEAGHDTLFGGAHADTLIGGAGRDSLVGGNGHDVLRGGGGRDILSGGNGADQFTFIKKWGHDTITDFGKGNDLLVFRKVNAFNSAQDVLDAAERVDGDTVITLNAKHSITLENFTSLETDDITVI